MKNVIIGLAGALLGLCLGIILAIGFFSVGVSSLIETPIPASPASEQFVTVTASEAYLNAQFQQVARQTNMLKNASVALDVPNIIRATTTVDVTVLGQRVNTNATVTMRVAVKSNRIVLTVEKIDAGAVPVPQVTVNNAIENLRAQGENQINNLIQRGLQGTGLRLANVRVTPSAMIVDLTSN